MYSNIQIASLNTELMIYLIFNHQTVIFYDRIIKYNLEQTHPYVNIALIPCNIIEQPQSNFIEELNQLVNFLLSFIFMNIVN